MKSRLFTLLVLIITLHACCTEEWRFEDDVRITLAEIEFGQGQPVGLVADTIRGPFQFRADGQYLLATAVPIIRPAQVLMGYSCDEEYDRVFDTETYQLTLNRSVVLAGQTINPGSNLLPALQEAPLGDAYVVTAADGLEIGFLEGVLASADIPAGDYTFTFTGTMEDGTVFSRMATVYLDL